MERAPAAGHKTLSNARPLCKYFLFKKAKIDFCHLTFDILLSKKVQIVVQWNVANNKKKTLFCFAKSKKFKNHNDVVSADCSAYG